MEEGARKKSVTYVREFKIVTTVSVAYAILVQSDDF